MIEVQRDVIAIRGVTAWGCHGVLASEKTRPQPFVVDVDLQSDLSWSGASDDLTDSTSYAEIAAQVVARIQGPGVDLVERLAALIAADCLVHELVEAVTVTVRKPHAPVGVAFDDVAVSVRRSQCRSAIVALGANQPGPAGSVADTLASAALALDDLPATRLRALSPLVASEPMTPPGRDAQRDDPYLNAVAVLATDLHPRTLLARLHDIEADHGRVRDVRWGPRTLDLDLVDVRGATGEPLAGLPGMESVVRLPHPGVAERDFVLVPWRAVDPFGARAFAPEGAQRSAGGGVRPGPLWPEAVRRFVRTIGATPPRLLRTAAGDER